MSQGTLCIFIMISLHCDHFLTIYCSFNNQFQQVGRMKQKRGYKDLWPWNIKIYTDDAGNNKGDAVLSYEDPSAAHSAGNFYNGMLVFFVDLV